MRKYLYASGYSRTTVRLQWGRNFIVAEIRTVFQATAMHGQASMGPQLYRCGNPLTRQFAAAPRTCFNGAATLSLRKCRCVRPVFRGRACFNGAATLSLRKWKVCRCSLQAMPRFNGAATLSLRKSSRRKAGRSKHVLASMGPQLYRCGNSASNPEPPSYNLRFNGAATLSLRKFPTIWSETQNTSRVSLQWGRNFIVAETGSLRVCLPRSSMFCFNGAATLSLRKPAFTLTPSFIAVYAVLQWGRNFIVAEILEDDSRRIRDRNHACFNGAATLSLRKLAIIEP